MRTTSLTVGITLPCVGQQDAYRGQSGADTESGLQICDLLVEGRDGFFEHSPVCGRTCAAEVEAGPCPRQLEGTSTLFRGLLFRRHLWTDVDLSPGRFLLLGFHRLGFKSSRHGFILR